VRPAEDNQRCRFLDCEESARVRVAIMYVYPYDGRERRKQTLRLCPLHAELLQRIIKVQIIGMGIDDASGSDDST